MSIESLANFGSYIVLNFSQKICPKKKEGVPERASSPQDFTGIDYDSFVKFIYRQEYALSSSKQGKINFRGVSRKKVSTHIPNTDPEINHDVREASASERVADEPS